MGSSEKHAGRSWKDGFKVALVLNVAFLVFACAVGATFGKVKSAAIGYSIFVLPLLAAWVLWFFRDHSPAPPHDTKLVISPAHGRVDYVDECEETCFMGMRCRRISIYLSLWNVHVQYSPFNCSIRLIQHCRGSLLRAIDRGSSDGNEHLLMGLQGSNEITLALRLISGPFVRRIVSWVTPGDSVQQGERIGLIRFGSRVDVYLPLTAKVLVQPGEKLVGGQTPIAKLS